MQNKVKGLLSLRLNGKNIRHQYLTGLKCEVKLHDKIIKEFHLSIVS